MRLVSSLLALTLTVSLASADEAKTPEAQPEPPRTKVSLRVVKVMPESHQALLYDKHRGTHVLADVGSAIDGYRVISIEDDEVTLSAEGREVVLAAPAQRWRQGGATPKPVKSVTPKGASADPVDPYAPAADADASSDPFAPSADAPVDPYATSDRAPTDPFVPSAEGPADPYAEPPVRAVAAPRAIRAGEDGIRVAAAPRDPQALDASERIGRSDDDNTSVGDGAESALVGSISQASDGAATSPPAVKHPATKPEPRTHAADAGIQAFADAMSGTDEDAPASRRPAPASAIGEDPYGEGPNTSPARTASPAATGGATTANATVVSRRDVTAALADFGALTRSLHGSFTASGAQLDKVAPGSVFAKAGLRDGDLVTAVDGKPLRSIDDAADLYVNASTVRTTTVQIVRAGTPMTLRLAIQ